jgi:DNA-binding CsgD family transcriptional regulator
VKVNLGRIGDVTLNIGAPGFGRSFFRLFADAFGVRFCTVFAFPSASEPLVIVSEGAMPGDGDIARKLAAGYAKNCYDHVTGVASPTVTRTTLPASTCFRRRWFEAPWAGYQLVQFSALEGIGYSVSLCRDERAGAFCAKDVAAMRRLGRFAFPAVHRHLDLERQSNLSRHDALNSKPSPVATLDTPAMRAHMRQVFLEAPHHLTPREAEVCAGIVLGYSTTTIGLNLQITFNTVATHRKRAYKKLGVSTQNELFARYFDNIRGMYAEAQRSVS